MFYDEQDALAILQSGNSEMGWITAAITAGATILGGLFGGGNSGVAKGLAGITNFANEVIARLESLKNDVANGSVTYSDAIKEANDLQNALSNPQMVYQAKKGRDAEALNNFKSQARQMVSEIKQIAMQVQTNTVQQQQSIFGGNSNTLVLAGAGLFAIYLLKNEL